MAADELDENEDVGTSAPKKKGGLGAVLPTILKWVAIIVGAIILIVTVVIITMSIRDKNSDEAVSVRRENGQYVPKHEDLSWFTTLGQIQVSTNDVPPATAIMEVVLGYKEDDKVASAEISKNQIRINEFLRRYFATKSKEEMRIEDEDKMKIEIRNHINDDILVDSKIRDVIFKTNNIIE